MKHVLFATLLMIPALGVKAQAGWHTVNYKSYWTIQIPTYMEEARGTTASGLYYFNTEKFGSVGDFLCAVENLGLGDNSTPEEQIAREYFDVLKRNHNISYKVLKGRTFVVSGVEGNEIFYQKAVASRNGIFTLSFHYSSGYASEVSRLISRMASSFKAL